MSNKQGENDKKDAIILHLRKIIRELEKENKELYKKLGLIYRPSQSGSKGKDDGDDGEDGDDGDDGDARDTGGDGDA